MIPIEDACLRFADSHRVDKSNARSLARRRHVEAGFEDPAVYLYAMLIGDVDPAPFLDELRGEVSQRPETRTKDSQMRFDAINRVLMFRPTEFDVFRKAFQGSPIAEAAKTLYDVPTSQRATIVALFCDKCGEPNAYSGGDCISPTCENNPLNHEET